MKYFPKDIFMKVAFMDGLYHTIPTLSILIPKIFSINQNFNFYININGTNATLTHFYRNIKNGIHFTLDENKFL